MARCGRCGLWEQYADDSKEKKYAGTCLWYQFRLPEEEVFESRECSDFIERIPGYSSMDHFNYKVRRDDIGTAYKEARFSKRLSITALVMSIAGLLWNVIKAFM
jgi:hypothetical protein